MRRGDRPARENRRQAGGLRTKVKPGVEIPAPAHSRGPACPVWRRERKPVVRLISACMESSRLPCCCWCRSWPIRPHIHSGHNLQGVEPQRAGTFWARPTGKRRNGEVIGTVRQGGYGGWLVLDRSYQDVGLYANFRCNGGCRTGILLRAEKTAEGMKGIYISLTRETSRLTG